VPRDRKTLFDGIESRLGNVSEVWAWLNQRDVLAREEAAGLFTDVRLTTVASEEQETAEHLVAVTRNDLDVSRSRRVRQTAAGAGSGRRDRRGRRAASH
jgi:hypothetical protein